MNNNNTTYKDSPLGKIPGDWEFRTLDHLFEFKNGINASKASYGDGVKFINVMEVIYNNCITAEMIPGNVKISDKQVHDFLIKRGDVLFNRTSETTEEIGLAAVYLDDEEVVFGGFVIRGTPKDNSLNDHFKKYCFHTDFVRNQIIKGGQGAVRSNIGQGDLEKVIIILPPLPEQKAIAHVLGGIDSAINTNNQLIAKKELQKKWLMQNLLTGKTRLKGFIAEWKKEKLESYILKHDEKSTLSNQYPVLTSSRRGIFLQSDYYSRDVASEDNTGYNVVPRGFFTYRHMSDDLVFKFNINDIVDKGIVSTLYPVFTIKDINAYFLLSKLNEGTEFKIHALEQKQGGSRTYVYFKTLCQLKLNLPSIEEQTSIAKVLQAADKEIQLLKAKTEKLRVQKKGLMQVLLTGKKRLVIN